MVFIEPTYGLAIIQGGLKMFLRQFKLFAAMALLALAGLFSTGQVAHAVTVDVFLESMTLQNSGGALEIASLETAAGLSAGSLTLETQDESVSFTLVSGTTFMIDLGLSTPGYFLLKFGVGETGLDTHYFFQNLVDLTKLVFTNAQVNFLMDIEGNDIGGALSHYTTAAISAVPIPATGLLLLGALGLLIAMRRRRKTA